jgi:hypothetical protein
MEPQTRNAIDWRWPIWAIPAGVLGVVAQMFSAPAITEADRQAGVSVIGLLDSTNYHIGVVAGLIAVFCLLVFAAGWQRWSANVAPLSLAGGLVTLALVASAGAMIIGYGVKGMLAIYLPGGLNETSYPAEGLYTLFMIDDLVPFIAWNGVAMASIGMAWLAFGERRLPVWMGIVSVVLLLFPLGMLLVFGLPGPAGITFPLWMIVIGAGLAYSQWRTPVQVKVAGFAPAGD